MKKAERAVIVAALDWATLIAKNASDNKLRDAVVTLFSACKELGIDAQEKTTS